MLSYRMSYYTLIFENLNIIYYLGLSIFDFHILVFNTGITRIDRLVGFESKGKEFGVVGTGAI